MFLKKLFLVVPVLLCFVQALRREWRYSSLRGPGLSLWWLLLLWGTGPGVRGPGSRDSQALERGPVVVAHGLSCSTACGIFLDQELKLCPLHWQADSYPLCHQESPCFLIFKNLSFQGSFRLTPKLSEDTEISHMSLFPHMHPYQYPCQSGTLATNDD